MVEGCDGSGTRTRYASSIRRAIDELGLPGIALMENAGAEAARAVRERYGDGVTRERAVRARQQRRRRLRGRPPPARGRPRGRRLPRMRRPRARRGRPHDARGRARRSASRERAPEDAGVIVDALFGSGFRGRLEGAAEALAARANALAAPIVALDVPSGVDGAERARGGRRDRGRAHAGLPRPHAGHGDRAGARPCGRGRSSCPSACRARSRAPRAPGAWIPPTSRSCPRARRPAPSTTRAACSWSADLRA